MTTATAKTKTTAKGASVLDPYRARGNEAALRLIGYVLLWPDTQNAQEALRTLSPAAVGLLDEAPRTILENMRALLDAGKVPDADALTLTIGFEKYYDLGCAVAISDGLVNPAVVPASAVEVVNALAVADSRHRAAWLLIDAIRKGGMEGDRIAAEARGLLWDF